MDTHEGRAAQSPVESAAYECRVCTRRFHNPNSLRIHTGESDLSAVRWHSCTSCEKSFCSRQGLQSHAGVKYQHSDFKPFQCNICGKAFHAQAGLRMHRRDKHNVDRQDGRINLDVGKGTPQDSASSATTPKPTLNLAAAEFVVGANGHHIANKTNDRQGIRLAGKVVDLDGLNFSRCSRDSCGLCGCCYDRFLEELDEDMYGPKHLRPGFPEYYAYWEA